MKSKFMISAIVLSLICLTSPLFAEKGSHKGSMMEDGLTAEKTQSGAIKVGNTICPLSKEKVDVMGDIVEYEHDEKVYNFCCKMCLKDFKKDPDKYIKIVDEMMASEVTGEVEESSEEHDHESHSE